ncbi:MAG: transketolase family protein [Caldisphaera sp.]|jgi:transketolase|nr:transketolase C-terminal domain-containing protein [Caldisphaera sp.]PMP91530.1 MAG: transketolase [Caldisphaera sp.]
MILDSSYRESLGKSLVEIGESNNDVVVVDSDVSKSTYTKYFAERFPDRFISVGISEQDLVGFASGLALGNKIPIAVTFSMFLMRAWEQIRNTIARDKLNVKLVGTHSGLSDFLDGSSHQSLEDIALMRILPNFIVLAPSDSISTKKLLYESILNHIGPVYIRLGRDNSPRIYDDNEEFKIGRSKVICEGKDIAFFSYGPMVEIAKILSSNLKNKGISSTVIDFYSIKPFDEDTVLKFSKRSNYIVTLEEHNVIGGIGDLISSFLSFKNPKKVIKFGIEDKFGTSARSYFELLEFFKLLPHNIEKKLEVIINEL